MSIPGSASPLFIGAAAAEVAGYQIDRSLRFNSADSAYLNRTPSSAGNSKTFTWSGWVKQVVTSGTAQTYILAAGSSPYFQFYFAGPTLYVETNLGYIQPSRVFRDPSAWYHFVVAVDTTQATATNRIRFYVNGEEVTDFTTDQRSSITQNADLSINSAVEHRIGAQTAATAYSNMSLAEVHFVDGTQLAPTDFGEYDNNGIWQPKEYSGTYNTNGFKLDFSDNTSTTTIAEDSSGNNNDWTANNISVSSGSGNDSLIDTPTNYTASSGNNNGGNYATLNPLDRQSTNGVLSNGNLDIKQTAAAWAMYRSTMFVSSGKWYWEVTIGNNQYTTIGICSDVYQMASGSNNWANASSEMFGYYPYDGNVYNGSNTISYATGDTSASGSIVGVALDMDNGTLTFYKDGTSLGQATSGLTGKNVSPTHWLYSQTGADSYNFGQRPFAYTPPTGHLSLCTTNLPDPTIADGSTAMDVVTYTGNGSTQTISGLDFSPDLVWIKNRAAADSHKLTDTVRGATKELESNTTAAEATNADGLTAFNSDGFDLGADAEYNTNTEAYVAWSFDGGSSTVSNTDGSITSNVRTNGSFSIVSYTGNGTAGATIGHGLNAVPGLLIVKNRSTSVTSPAWGIKHSGLYFNSGYWLKLENNDAAVVEGPGSGSLFNATNPGSSVFTVGPRNTTNTNGDNYIAYCWAPVEGYSAFGSFTGTGTSDNSAPFIYTGFRPRWLLIKSSSNGEQWLLYDSARDTYNLSTAKLYPNLAVAENGSPGETSSTNTLDFLSNGFKLRTSNTATNGSNYTYIYAAFAEHPFASNARAR